MLKYFRVTDLYLKKNTWYSYFLQQHKLLFLYKSFLNNNTVFYYNKKSDFTAKIIFLNWQNLITYSAQKVNLYRITSKIALKHIQTQQIEPDFKKCTAKLLIEKNECKSSFNWNLGYRKISFHTKKTITYRKNRLVHKDKLIIKFSKLYNFFYRLTNMLINLKIQPKSYLYIYLYKKRCFSIKKILYKVSKKIVVQNEKPLIIPTQVK